MIVTAASHFCAGHRLLGYPGRCAHVHGHNYKLEVAIIGPTDEMGFVIDFKTLKEKVKVVVDPFDHAFIVNEEDPLLQWLEEHWQRRIVLNENPTAENIAQVIYNQLQPEVSAPLSADGLFRVKLQETEDNWAVVSTRDTAVFAVEVYP